MVDGEARQSTRQCYPVFAGVEKSTSEQFANVSPILNSQMWRHKPIMAEIEPTIGRQRINASVVIHWPVCRVFVEVGACLKKVLLLKLILLLRCVG